MGLILLRVDFPFHKYFLLGCVRHFVLLVNLFNFTPHNVITVLFLYYIIVKVFVFNDVCWLQIPQVTDL